MQFYDIFPYLLMYFDFKNTEKISISWVHINCLIIWKKDDIQKEISFFAVTPFKIHLKLNAYLIYVN